MDEAKSEDIDSLFEEDPGPLDEEDADDLKLDKLDTKIWLVKVHLSVCMFFSCQPNQS